MGKVVTVLDYERGETVIINLPDNFDTDYEVIEEFITDKGFYGNSTGYWMLTDTCNIKTVNYRDIDCIEYLKQENGNT